MPVTFVESPSFDAPAAVPRASPPKKRKPKPSRGNFADHDSEQAAAVVRGAMAALLDTSFADGALGRALWQGDDPSPRAVRFMASFCALAKTGDQPGMLRALRSYGLDVYQEIAVALFPELYGEPEQAGIVPEGGPERVGQDRLEAFARIMSRGSGAG
jgi:hypothetical protein